MKKNPIKRWRLFADARLQGQMCARLAVYWMFCQASMVGTIVAMSCLFEGTQTNSSVIEMHFIVPALAVSTLLFPIFLFEILAFSNRFAGPMVSFRRQLKQLAENETCEKLTFREGDFYLELADHFNQIQEKVQSQSKPEEKSNTSFLPPLETSDPTGMESHV